MKSISWISFKSQALTECKLVEDNLYITEDKIISELKTKGKYEEWVKLGSYYGLTCDYSKIRKMTQKFMNRCMPNYSYYTAEEIFSVRPYKYYDVDGNIVNVSTVVSKDKYGYIPDLNNIAVFKQIPTKDPSYVCQSKYRIVNSNETLSTAGLATCSALAFILGTKKFMTHLDANTSIKIMISDIKKHIVEENINPNSIKPVIYIGKINSSITLNKAKKICLEVGIPTENYKILDVRIFDKVSI